MTTISVPLTPELEESLKGLVASGYGSNKADVIRRALKKADEDEAVNRILLSEQEPSLHGDLKSLMKKIK
jgi:Arc/MetJ-type ribon-helix-helix transcriptional regulator